MESRFQDSTESIREEIFPSIEPYLHSLVGKKEKKREKKKYHFYNKYSIVNWPTVVNPSLVYSLVNLHNYHQAS